MRHDADVERPFIDGVVDPRFATVRTAFGDVLAAQPGTGAALAVWHDGAWVVDLWGGHADAARTRPWARDSLVMPYSVTKPFAATCVLALVDRGRIDLDQPVARYWPGFSAPATVRHLLAHQAGVVALDDDLPTEALYDQGRMAAALGRQAPAWTPGEGLGEAALLYGHLLGELVRRVDGRSLGAFLREEVCEPHDLDFHIGLTTRDLGRTVELTGYDEAFRRSLDADYGPLFRRAADNPPGALDPAVVNSEAWRRAEIGAVNGHGTARAVAGFYVALSQGRILSDDLLREATAAQAHGIDRVIGGEATWGLGFGVDDDGFGMGGLGGSLGWWSRVGGYAIAFLTGYIGDHARSERLENAVRDVLWLPPI